MTLPKIQLPQKPDYNKIAKVHDKFPQFMFGVYTDGLVLDKVTNELLYFYYENDRSDMLHTSLRTPSKRGAAIPSSFGKAPQDCFVPRNDGLRVHFLRDSL